MEAITMSVSRAGCGLLVSDTTGRRARVMRVPASGEAEMDAEPRGEPCLRVPQASLRWRARVRPFFTRRALRRRAVGAVSRATRAGRRARRRPALAAGDQPLVVWLTTVAPGCAVVTASSASLAGVAGMYS